MTTGLSGCRSRAALRTANPSSPGMARSEMTMSNFVLMICRIAADPSTAGVTTKSKCRRSLASVDSIESSSSTTRADRPRNEMFFIGRHADAILAVASVANTGPMWGGMAASPAGNRARQEVARDQRRLAEEHVSLQGQENAPLHSRSPWSPILLVARFMPGQRFLEGLPRHPKPRIGCVQWYLKRLNHFRYRHFEHLHHDKDLAFRLVEL